MVGDSRDPASHRDGRSFAPAAGLDTLIRRREVGRFAVSCGLPRLRERTAEGLIAFARPRLVPFPRTLVASGTHAGPGNEMISVRKARHVRAHFSHDHLRHALAHP